MDLPADNHDKIRTTWVCSRECPAKKIGSLVLLFDLNVQPWDYNEPPGKAFPDGFLILIIGFLCLSILGHSIQPIFYNCKIRMGKRTNRLDRLTVDITDLFKSMFY